ncbi:hypothetical protein QTP70_014855 [Hemibagrus guttatus]|uniref:Uncharacterized protein n=1 Tax=Hemibagrus guttatus TaxID=175788 RepID=A0AAE0UJZ2_9TELE|nr:hypothetical protein QTP70_014855 [Hemibagrus guttatus]
MLPRSVPPSLPPSVHSSSSLSFQHDPLIIDLPSSPVGRFSFRPLPPPPPPPHACVCSPTSSVPDPVQRNTLPSRNHQTENKMQQDKTHNTWALNSNIPLETRKSCEVVISESSPCHSP